MLRARHFSVLLLVFMVAALVSGCGKSVQLSFDSSRTNPVIVYKSYRAIAPEYNPTAPVTIVYGDGTVIKKKDAYEFTTGKIASPGVKGLLDTLDKDGFFKLEKEYRGEDRPGSATETVTVKLSDKTYEVSVQEGEGPPGWGKILSAVSDVKTTGAKEHVPQSITLFAKEVDEVPTVGVQPWPGNAEDLKKAAASDKGVKLSGEDAATAWKAVQKSLAMNVNVLWKADGKIYGVYASPIFPGVAEQ